MNSSLKRNKPELKPLALKVRQEPELKEEGTKKISMTSFEVMEYSHQVLNEIVVYCITESMKERKKPSPSQERLQELERIKKEIQAVNIWENTAHYEGQKAIIEKYSPMLSKLRRREKV